LLAKFVKEDLKSTLETAFARIGNRLLENFGEFPWKLKGNDSLRNMVKFFLSESFKLAMSVSEKSRERFDSYFMSSLDSLEPLKMGIDSKSSVETDLRHHFTTTENNAYSLRTAIFDWVR